MAQDANDLSGAEEYVAAEIDLTEPLGLEEEKNLRDALQQLDARVFASCNIGPKKISLSYDPTRTRKEVLLHLIRDAGGKLEHVVSESSPLL